MTLYLCVITGNSFLFELLFFLDFFSPHFFQLQTFFEEKQIWNTKYCMKIISEIIIAMSYNVSENDVFYWHASMHNILTDLMCKRETGQLGG